MLLDSQIKAEKLTEQLFFSSWKSGILAKEDASNQGLAKALLASQALMVLFGVSQITTGFNAIATTALCFVYVLSGLNVALTGNYSRLNSFYHSYFTAFALTIFLSREMQLSSLMELLVVPYIIDAIYGIAKLTNERTSLDEEDVRNDTTQYVTCESPAYKWASRYLDMEFFEKMSTESWKMDAFNLKGAQNVRFQALSGLFILLQLYLAIVCAVDSQLANPLSVIVALSTTASLATYFGKNPFMLVNVLASDAFSLLLAGFSLGVLMSAISNNQGISYFGYSFLLMTQVLLFDAFYGFLQLLSKNSITQEASSSEERDFASQFYYSNWKNSLFRSHEVQTKMAAFSFLFLEFVLGYSASFTGHNLNFLFGFIISKHALIGLYCFFKGPVSNVVNFLHSYFSCFVITALIVAFSILDFKQFNLSAFVIAAIFLADTAYGVKFLQSRPTIKRILRAPLMEGNKVKPIVEKNLFAANHKKMNSI